ncbi:histidine kinase dimerization/phosphoacceptor domain -containing protein [Hymenobacter sp. YC55]|uniref:tetratricopeptide repeat-containing sensor histidine kinase n=1 Tax=Hymenobacter sp. YC55 TaxID=3034019 RepID=UPI0023F630F7|nr:histidine kinase dimerization/phosphoacceptor domain -containing protein [Hymenobacter sp. YC55]MDF7811458.1 histidine kinase dimerization/phosphoacceptor domain -containing protein [Hymenobacter sp. YC55]
MKRLCLLLLLLMAGFASPAEPLYPLLNTTSIDSLRRVLWRSPPNVRRARLLLALSNSLINSHEELDTPLDSAYAYGRQAEVLSKALRATDEQIGSQYTLGRIMQYLPTPADGKGLIRQALARSHQRGNKRQEAEGWYYLGVAYPRSATGISQRITCFQRAATLYQALGDKEKEAFILKAIADMYLVQGNSLQARDELLRVVALYRSVGYRRLHYTYDLLRAASRNSGNFKEALRYGIAAIESAETTKDTASLAYFYTTVGTVYTNLNQPEEAFRYFKQALKHAHYQKTVLPILDIAGGIAYVLIAQQQPRQALAFFQQEIRAYPATDNYHLYYVYLTLATCYTATEQFEVAEKYEARLISLLRDKKVYADDYSQQLTAYFRLSQLCVSTQRYEKARGFLRQAKTLQPRVGSAAIAAKLELLLFKVDSAETKFPAAIAHYQRYKALNDSIFNETKNKQLASLEVQYDTRKKEQNIALLTKQTQVQQASLRQREFQRNAFFVGALLLALVLGLVYNRYRLKQRSNHLLEDKQAEINQQNQSLHDLLQEKDWMLREIHHRVKNNLEIISSLLETQSDYIQEPSALAALREGQNRVHAMALIHQKLYQSENLAVVNMQAYIGEITEYLLESFDCQDTVRMELAVVPVELEVTLATPLGLIINEALTNALKYAFQPQQPGTITVELVEAGQGQYHLTIADDGAGFPPGFNLEDSHTMGLTIMRGLSGQIDGTLRITQTPGVRISLAFAAVTSPVQATFLPV